MSARPGATEEAPGAAGPLAILRANRRMAVTLAVIVLLGVGLRAGLVLGWGQDTAYASMIYTNANVALNIEQGDGFVNSITTEGGEFISAVESRPFVRLTSFQEMRRLYGEEDGGDTPSLQQLPGYPYFVAAVWKVTPGEPSFAAGQLATGTLDGMLGPAAVWLVLAVAGLSRAGVIGAVGYAVQPMLIYQSTRFMPDALSAVLPLVAVVTLVVCLQQRRDLLGAALAGGILGLGAWLRSDYVAVLVLLIPLVVLLVRRSRQRRALVLAVLAGVWLIPAAGLSAFYAQQHGEFHVTRPGLGLLLWEGIGQRPNPWGIEPGPENNLDHAADRLLTEHGYVYGSVEADSFLMSQALSHLREDPTWFVEATTFRVLRVLGMRIPEGPTWLLVAIPLAISPLVVGGTVLLWRRSPLVTGALVVLFASRVIPFAVLYDQFRFVILVAAVYSTLMAVALDWLLARYLAGRPEGWRARVARVLARAGLEYETHLPERSGQGSAVGAALERRGA